ncbi:ATP-binding protein [Lyngbya confervoides]|uniref:ATP-binding protein n=1 Tax=Lyngbya confervoides BDU141951 TaxID=1574623 RepID=A0ABD4T4U9_9CYAN|nr:ATP-binding protein [Lyngbya confervoides]MCM1983262.1 ATP-binding protein [Lyngbya confervoides BDU141951]
MNAAQIYASQLNGQTPRPLESGGSLLERVLLRVRILAQRRSAWLAKLWADLPATEGHGYLQTCLSDSDQPDAEQRWIRQAEAVQPLTQTLQQLETALAGAVGAPLQQLAKIFSLTQPELDLFQTCLALKIDPSLGPVFAHLQLHPNRPYATDTLAARLFGHGYRPIWQPDSPLAIWQLLHPLEAAPGDPLPLEADPGIVAWLQGELRLDADLVPRIQGVPVRPPLERWPVAATARHLERVLQQEAAVRLCVTGPQGSGRRSFAAAVAQCFGLDMLSVNTEAIAAEDWLDLYVRVQRLAILGNLALVWWGPGLTHRWPDHLTPAPLQFLACEATESIPDCARVLDERLVLAPLTQAERRQLWQRAIPETAAWPAAEVDLLVSRYRLTPGDIAAIGRRSPIGSQEVIALARNCTRHQLGQFGRRLDCPFTWDDLVLPDSVAQELADFAFEAQTRDAFWESTPAQRLFPRGTGLVGLFSGPPGTGKTMAAQVIAADLNLDLFRIDLATVVSKYIGETAKHLRQIFTRAERMNAVLLFDEADALFSKRTEVKDSHDRYANADTSYLLQLLEEYRGIAILATNKKQNVDTAFTRRIRYIIDFPRPDTAQRQRIWQQVLNELCGLQTGQRLASGITAIAASVDLSGAQIKNSVLASIFIARRSRAELAMAHLLLGVERELRKEGRALGSRERGRLMEDG